MNIKWPDKIIVVVALVGFGIIAAGALLSAYAKPIEITEANTLAGDVFMLQVGQINIEARLTHLDRVVREMQEYQKKTFEEIMTRLDKIDGN